MNKFDEFPVCFADKALEIAKSCTKLILLKGECLALVGRFGVKYTFLRYIFIHSIRIEKIQRSRSSIAKPVTA